MRLCLSAAAAILVVAPLSAQDATLRVLQHSPRDTASPGSVVTVIFDRPVAGSLDQTLEASRIFRIEPAVPGRVHWRDPVTIEFVPKEPLAPGSRFRVTIDDGFRAVDGTRLVRPYRFDFRVGGPRLLARSRGAWNREDAALPVDGKVLLLFSAPVDLDALRHGARLELTGCAEAKTVTMTPVRQRPLSESDPYDLQYADGGDAAGGRLRRVVELEPAAPLPPDCSGVLVLPTTRDDRVHGREERFPVKTAPQFRLLGFDCARTSTCAHNELVVQFTAPVTRTDVERYVHLEPRVLLSLADIEAGYRWPFSVKLEPRSTYTVTVDEALRDVHGRGLVGARQAKVATGDYVPSLEYARGSLVMPRAAAPTIPVRHINVRDVRVITYRVPERLRPGVLSVAPFANDQLLAQLAAVRPDTTIVSLAGRFNVDTTTELTIPQRSNAPASLIVVRLERVSRISGPESGAVAPVSQPARERGRYDDGFALLQLTDIAAHARVAAGGGTVIVTGLTDGRPRAGAIVRHLNAAGTVLAEARTNEAGIAQLGMRAADVAPGDDESAWREWTRGPRGGLIEAALDGDRVMLPLGVRAIGYWTLNPLQAARLGGRLQDPPPAAAMVFTDRGIYRPGERFYIKGVVRLGPLGSLTSLPAGDSVRVTVTHRANRWEREDDVVIRDTVLHSTEFGTVGDSISLRSGVPLGEYEVALHLDVGGSWKQVAAEHVRVAEYRAPEFLVEARTDSMPHYGGDTIRVRTAANYLFGAPMSRALVSWRAELRQSRPWELRIPGSQGWIVGEWTVHDDTSDPSSIIQGDDTLDATGLTELRVPVAGLRPSRPGRVDVHVAVVDVNRQAVTATTTVAVHPSSVYVLARHQSKGWLWTVGQRQVVEIRTVRPNGDNVSDVPVQVTVVRRIWHRYGRMVGYHGRSMEDTVTTDTVYTRAAPVGYEFIPEKPGPYELRLTASDEQGAIARTSMHAWAMGGGGSWWANSPFHLALVADQDEYATGDTAKVVFDSPFEHAEAWVTVERERILEQRRLRIRRGTNHVSLPITERHAPNVFVSVALLNATPRGKERPDSAAQLVRAGYVEVRVGTAPKRLSVALTPGRAELRPRDTAEIRVEVRDSRGRGVRSEVTLWAVDEGVLALTDFKTPDLLRGMYRPRGLGAALWSTWPMVLTANPELMVELAARAEMRLSRLAHIDGVATAVAGSAEEALATALRSQFRSTAFFIASVVTQDNGRATARATVPDNLTTYRVMATAVSGGDRFGSGDTTILVTRPLVARPTFPRFVRPGDSLLAGAVVNARDGSVRHAEVRVVAEGLSIRGMPRREIALEQGRGAEARFPFAVPGRDSVRDTVTVRVGASDGEHGDAVETRLAVRPDFHPRTHVRLGALHGSADIAIPLPRDIDPGRSRVSLRVGVSPLAPMLVAYDRLNAYPFDCTEQIVARGRALIAVWRASRLAAPGELGGDPRASIQLIVDELVRRQAASGAIRYWRTHEWTSPWLSAYAGFFLLEARDAGATVETRVIGRLAEYLSNAAEARVDTGGMNRFERRRRRLALGDRVAIVDFLRRLGDPDEKAEDALRSVVRVMTWEDRLRLAEMLVSRKDARDEAHQLLEAAWRAVTTAGRRVDLPDTAHTDREFPSRVAPAARLLTATIAIQSDHPRLGGLIETVLQQGRAEHRWAWNTQDYASVVTALASLADDDSKPREVHVLDGGRVVLSRRAGEADSAVAVPIAGLLKRARDGNLELRLGLSASEGKTPVYYAVVVEEVPSKPPVTPDIQGMVVERWYERLSDGRPVTAVREGELVRVRLRITVPSDRHFVALEDPLPAGLEPIDLSLRTSGTLQPFMDASVPAGVVHEGEEGVSRWHSWLYGRWEDGGWSPWEHKSLYDDRVVYFARMLWPGTYTATYVARATVAGNFVRPPAHAEEMYNPGLHGRSDGGLFGIGEKK